MPSANAKESPGFSRGENVKPELRKIMDGVQWPLREQYAQHEWAYDLLRRDWDYFTGAVRDPQHFMLAVTVEQKPPLPKEIWCFCAEYNRGSFRLLWLRPKQVNKNLLPLPKKHAKIPWRK